MSQGLEEIIQEEAEGGLSAPVNLISDDAVDCGCKQLQCPRLTKYATRPVYLTILCLIGVLQAAAQNYLLITNSAVSRRFVINHYTMEWVLGIFHIATFLGGLAIAYWGDKIHRASWTGALVLLQSICFLTFIIPQFTHPNRTIEEPIDSNVTHLSIYAEDSPEKCIKEGSARIITDDNDTCYFILFLYGVAQILSGLGNVAYYALGVSYLDDNTKRKNVPPLLGLIIAAKILGLLLGSLLAWSFLRIDADNFNPVESYREQIGAWWLGWPILAVLLAIPALLLAIFPRRLVSEIIQQAAGEILNDSGSKRKNYNPPSNKIDSTLFLPSMLRILTNKILLFNVASASLCAMAMYNFFLNENLYLESKFHIPRPNGLLLGFNDPITSRAVTNILKPLMTGITVIVSGLIIAKIRPKANFLTGCNFVVILLTGIIIFTLAFNDCKKYPIVGDKYGDFELIKYCNQDCRCIKDADFRPVCDDSGIFTFYSACYAGCTVANIDNGIKSYDRCTCIGDMTGNVNFKATEGACEFRNCQPGWIMFGIFTILAYSLIASSIVSDFLINLRSSKVQDKALTIAFWMIWMAFFIQIPGKLIYKVFADSTCKHWGMDKHMCHFHSDNYGGYLCFITAFFLLLGAILKAAVYFLSKNLQLYEFDDEEDQGEELKEVTQIQSQPLLHSPTETANENSNVTSEVSREPEATFSEQLIPEEPKVEKDNAVKSPPLNQDSVEVSGSRTVSLPKEYPSSLCTTLSKSKISKEDLDTSSDESNVFGKSPGSKISYKPLELDSDTESDLCNYGPRSRKRIPSQGDNNPNKKQQSFPNPDNYEDPRNARRYKMMTNDDQASSLEDSKLMKFSELSKSQGDFNEVGIPIVESYGSDCSKSKISFDKSHDSIIMCQYDSSLNRSRIEEAKLIMRSMDEMRVPLDMEKTLRMLTENLVRPPSRDQESSGFGSLQNISDSNIRHSPRRRDSKESLNSKTSISTSESHSKNSPITTDL